MKKYKVLDLFAGCGGFSTGLSQVDGFEIVVANEVDASAAKVYRDNHQDTLLIEGDITSDDVKDSIISASKEQEVNFVVGGIPCQTFSMSGKRDENDPRGQLYKDYFQVVESLQPEIAIIENVKGLMSMKHNGQNVLDLWLQIFRDLGYQCDYRLMKASEYGAPQHRQRVIIIAVKEGSILWPEKTHNENNYVTVKDAIDDLKNIPENKSWSHTFRVYRNDPTVPEKIINCEFGKSYSGFGEANHKCDPNKPSPTVKENHGAVFTHYEVGRHMTPRELARLQTFPDDFVFNVGKGQAFKQLGNAVPPLLGKVIGKSILEMRDTTDEA